MPESVAVDDSATKAAKNVGDYETKENAAEKIAEVIEEEAASVSDAKEISGKGNRLFGREMPVHHVLGGGKSADVLLWRNKHISASFLASSTIIWVLFEWLNYHFLSLVCFVAVLGMVVQFLWSNASGFKSISGGSAPRLVLSEELVINIAKSGGVQANRVLQYIQDVSCGGDLKQFLMIVGSMWAAAILGSWCNFITVIYVGIVAAHTLPVVYEKYDDQIDDFAMKVLRQLQGQYLKMDSTLATKKSQSSTQQKKEE